MLSGNSPILWAALGLFAGWLLWAKPAVNGGAPSAAGGLPVYAPTMQPTTPNAGATSYGGLPPGASCGCGGNP